MRTQEKHQADGVSSQQILRLFSCLNPLVWREECAVSNLCSSLSQRRFDNHLIPWSQLRLRGRGWGCRGVCRRAGAEGNSWQDQGLAPQGTSAFLARLSLTGHECPECPVRVPVLGAWMTHLLLSWQQWEISQVTQGRAGKGSGILQGLQTSA